PYHEGNRGPDAGQRTHGGWLPRRAISQTQRTIENRTSALCDQEWIAKIISVDAALQPSHSSIRKNFRREFSSLLPSPTKDRTQGCARSRLSIPAILVISANGASMIWSDSCSPNNQSHRRSENNQTPISYYRCLSHPCW